MTITQQNRSLRVETPLGPDVLLFHRMSATERLGGLFEFDLEMLSENHNVDLDRLLGQTVTVTMPKPDNTVRYFHGVVAVCCQNGQIGELARYRAVVRPWLWLLTRTSDCRIFQNMTVPEIVTKVVRDRGFTDIKTSLQGTYRPQEFCVQYCETDFNFISRLLESEGIYYFFQHAEGKHTLVLCDGIGSHAAEPGYEEIPYYPAAGNVRRERDHIDDWSISREVQPGTYALTDFDFTRPKADLKTKSAVKRKHAQAEYELFEYPGNYLQTADGETIARVRVEEFQCQFERVNGAGNARGLAAGISFKLKNYPRADQNREYLIVLARHELQSDDYQGGGSEEEYCCSFQAIQSQQTFRPERTTAKPVMRGPQTAMVVGKKNEEIWTDKYGRIKVQFHWDRYGKQDENSSCWVRVAQLWAGKNWGGLHIPRTGQEVIVEFLNGDPDQPIVTGCVYNADHMPPFALPDQMTQSGLRTRSTKEGNDKTGNELRFDDKKGAEQVYFHAERDFLRVVENNDTLRVGYDVKDPGDQIVEIYHDSKITIEKGNREVKILEADDLLTVSKGKRDVKIEKGDDLLTISQGKQQIAIQKGDHQLELAAGASTVSAAKSIELKVGGSSLKIEPAKITIKAPQVVIQADTQVQIKGTMLQAEASGPLTVKGAIVQIN